jgi:GT2 family glycosyltransferase
MESDCLEKLIDVLNANKNYAVAAPRLMRWNFSVLENNMLSSSNIQISFTNKIDSLGLKVLRNRRVVELGQGEGWVEKNESEFNEVFGVSGALPVYRRLAIQKLNEFFDPLFENYKEDVDLAFRLRSVGEKAIVVTNAVAYHDRQVVGKKRLDDVSASLNKRRQNGRIKYLSYRNHLMVLYKNEYWENFALDWPYILWYELKKFAYFLLFDRVVLGAWRDLWKNRKILKNKRNHLKKTRKITAKEMRGWWR